LAKLFDEMTNALKKKVSQKNKRTLK